MRALFINQGPIGDDILGHVAVEAALERGFSTVGDVDARFVRLPAWSLPQRLAGGRIPMLNAAAADLHDARWHLTEAVRGRRAITAALAERSADVLHVDSHVAAFLAARTMRRVPTVLSVDVCVEDWHAMPFSGRPPWYARGALLPSRGLERVALRSAAAVAARSAWAARRVSAIAPHTPVEVLHPGLDLGRFAPAPGGRPDGPARVLFVGARFEEKGGEDLLDALAPRLGVDVELDVVTPADVPARPGVTVHRAAPADGSLVRLYQAADVFCLPTRGDSFGWVILEAMGCGVPVVAAAVGAIPDLLGDGEAGFVTPPQDIRALRAALDTLIDDPALRARMGAAGRRRAQRDYDVERQAAKLAALFARIA